jgi:hypothetical protein
MQEIVELASDSPPDDSTAGTPIINLGFPSPQITHGLPFHESCAKHVKHTFHGSRVYIIASGSSSQHTHRLNLLAECLGRDTVVGYAEELDLIIHCQRYLVWLGKL